ncbi:hypothetical protein [Ferdinandcohnia sp. SAFN-114]|uniref:hypothetical protein n=1 Tax=Ferdinandcohnia sp. SAFN-114 TaxID=3387275 RepID=UPI003F7EF092
MKSVEEIQEENSQLLQKVNLLEQELYSVKQELHKQLNYREAELKETLRWEKKYLELQKRFEALRNSSLGNLTIKYWNTRKRLKNRFTN